MKNLLVITASCIALAGCMSGKMVGAMSDKQQVAITFDQGMTGDTYSTTIDGEYFEGKASMVDSSTRLTHAFGLSSHNAPETTMTNLTHWGFATKRRMKAVLIGNRAN